ncbi:MAG: dihydroorotate dehydrogenase electron transfer subunit [Magnetococcales bacterium]|nr:dihydroorotate dehydrogenase electron transfer subunit [Magnetococcales bacterium]
MSGFPPPLIGRHPARVLSNLDAPLGGLRRMILHAPELARTAQPGHFVQLSCGTDLTLRRPLSIAGADPVAGEVELLYAVVGEGTRRMVQWRPGDPADLLGPIGRPFTLPPPGETALLLGGGVGTAPMVYLARALAAAGIGGTLFVGFRRPEGGHRSAALPLGSPLEQALSNGSDQADGLVTDHAARRLESLPPEPRGAIRLYACGPPLMLRAVAALAQRFALSGEVSLEERMACGFGGCAGCVAPMKDPAAPQGWTHRRVCVDGPVFPLDAVDWERYLAAHGG